MATLITEALNAPLSCTPIGFALLAISGEERHAFLHAQFTNDLNLIKKHGAQLSAWCNPKGQVIANFLIINTGVIYLLLFKEDLKSFVQKRLTIFVLRSNVKIEDISARSSLFGLANKKDLSSLGQNISTTPGTVTIIKQLLITCLPYDANRYLIVGNGEILETKMPKLTASLKMVDSTIWELLDMIAGVAWITSITREQFLPQMLNLDRLKGLSYQKGCYPGQEIIARLYYRGKIKKRLQLIKSTQALAIGDPITLEQLANIGSIVNAAMAPDGHYYALAVIEFDKCHEKLLCHDKEIAIIEPSSLADL